MKKSIIDKELVPVKFFSQREVRPWVRVETRLPGIRIPEKPSIQKIIMPEERQGYIKSKKHDPL